MDSSSPHTAPPHSCAPPPTERGTCIFDSHFSSKMTFASSPAIYNRRYLVHVYFFSYAETRRDMSIFSDHPRRRERSQSCISTKRERRPAGALTRDKLLPAFNRDTARFNYCASPSAEFCASASRFASPTMAVVCLVASDAIPLSAASDFAFFSPLVIFTFRYGCRGS